MPTRTNQTTITISEEVKERLEKYKEADDVWDNVISEMIDAAKNGEAVSNS